MLLLFGGIPSLLNEQSDVGMYVCVYLCMDIGAWIHGYMDAWLHGLVGWLHLWMDGMGYRILALAGMRLEIDKF